MNENSPGEQTPEETLRSMLAEVAKSDVTQVGLDDDLAEELGLDSLAGLRLLATVEKRFDIRFPDDRLREYRTLRRILEVIAGDQQEAQS